VPVAEAMVVLEWPHGTPSQSTHNPEGNVPVLSFGLSGMIISLILEAGCGWTCSRFSGSAVDGVGE
jgi:hypothetical protein